MAARPQTVKRTHAARTGGLAPGRVDFDLHGIVGISLLGASPSDVAAVRRQIGPIEAPLGREPDIAIRFVPKLALPPCARLIGLADAACAGDTFMLVRGGSREPSCVQMPMDRLGGRCEIVAQSGRGPIPLLIQAINLTALAHGVLPLHASAFTYRGKGVLVTGWAKGGKTEALLAFMRNGAAYIGDEWVYVAPETGRLHGLPEPIKVWDWHLDDVPSYRTRLSRRDAVKLRAVATGQRVTGRLGSSSVMVRGTALLERQRYVRLTPHQLFGADACALTGQLDTLIFIHSHADSKVTARPVDGTDVAHRMAYSLQQERIDLMTTYQKFRFAFPDTPNPILDGAAATERRLLERALGAARGHVVEHPFPAPITRLFDVIAPLVAG